LFGEVRQETPAGTIIPNALPITANGERERSVSGPSRAARNLFVRTRETATGSGARRAGSQKVKDVLIDN
jgi:hypothetical protein